MLGIDIVDLKDPLLKERTERTINMIKNKEDVLIEHPHLFWILWSAKEAAFKCRREPLNFAPSNIPIKVSKNDEDILFSSGDLNGKIQITGEYIIALCGDLEEIGFEVFNKPDENWSEGIRKMIVDFFKGKGYDFQIGSDDLNLPTILPAKSEISISHHGRFGAVAFQHSIL